MLRLMVSQSVSQSNQTQKTLIQLLFASYLLENFVCFYACVLFLHVTVILQFVYYFNIEKIQKTATHSSIVKRTWN